MRTAEDLRAAFALLDEHAPTECAGPLDEPRTKSRRHRVLPLAGVAAAVAAVAIAVPLLVPDRGASTRSTPPAAAYEAPVTLRYSFTVDHVAGYTITPSAVERDVQRANITIGSGSAPDAADADGAIYVYARGAFDPTAAKGGRPVKVNGHAGYFARLTSPTLTGIDGIPAKLDAVVWQYAAGAWAMVQVRFAGDQVNARDEELKIARAVHPGHPEPTRVPFRFGYLPDGLVAEGAELERGGAWIYLGDGRPGGTDGDQMFGSALSVFVYPGLNPTPGSEPNGMFCQGQKRFTMDGARGCFHAPGGPGPDSRITNGLSLNAPGGLIEMRVGDTHLGRYSDDQLKQIAGTLRIATIIDQSTWFDATTAMPR